MPLLLVLTLALTGHPLPPPLSPAGAVILLLSVLASLAAQSAVVASWCFARAWGRFSAASR